MSTYLTTEQAAAYAGISKASLIRLRTQGGGPRYLKPTPRRVVYNAADLDEWLEQHSFRSTSEYNRQIALSAAGT